MPYKCNTLLLRLYNFLFHYEGCAKVNPLRLSNIRYYLLIVLFSKTYVTYSVAYIFLNRLICSFLLFYYWLEPPQIPAYLTVGGSVLRRL